MRIVLLRCFFVALVGILATVFAGPVMAQDSYDSAHPTSWISALELPFLFLAVFFAFRTAAALEGGAFGKGMWLLAWGFAVMAIGHLLMQAKMMFHVDVLEMLFGQSFGAVAWVIALAITWALSWLGFQSIYQASKG